MSYKVEVIADNTGNWTANALRFPTATEAEGYAQDLAWRWTSVRDKRIVSCDEPPNYRFAGGQAVPLEPIPLDDKRG